MALKPGSINTEGEWLPGHYDSNGNWLPDSGYEKTLAVYLEKSLQKHGVIGIEPEDDGVKLERRRFLVGLAQGIIDYLKDHAQIVFTPTELKHETEQFTVTVNRNTDGTAHTHPVSKTLVIKPHQRTQGKIE